tara:strand:- start:66 stop:1340 length:1275 start_codon:yes stop_codon:yes gene_type:complete
MDQSNQMDAMFKSSRTDEVDPVSGNEVPTGSLPEEVRDDIPAQLSEGEYVVPADVVRYFGVKFFEDIRSQAKQGFQELDQGGRIGGEPVGMEMGDEELPFDISELQMVDDGEPEQPMMNTGGYVSGYDEGGDVTKMREPDFLKNSGYDFGSVGPELIENRTYVNEAGLTMVIRFVNGVPDVPIPAGYKIQASAVEQAAPTVAPNEDRNDTPDVEPGEAIDWAEASLEDYGKVMKRRESLLGKATPGALAMVNPLLGAGAKIASNMRSESMIAGLQAKLKNPDLADKEKATLQGYYDTLITDQKDRQKDTKLGLVEKSGIYGGQSTMLENLKDTDNKKGASFGDTWLGDALGFDGQFGVQEAGLGASIGGARRDATPTGGGSSNDSTPTPTAPSGGGNSFFQNVANTFTPKDGKSYVDGKLKDDD